MPDLFDELDKLDKSDRTTLREEFGEADPGKSLDDSEVSPVVASQAAQAAMAIRLTALGYTVVAPAEKSLHVPRRLAPGSRQVPTFVRMLTAYATRAASNRAAGGTLATEGLTDEEVASFAGLSAHSATARAAEMNSLGLVDYVRTEAGGKHRRNRYAVRTITTTGLAVLDERLVALGLDSDEGPAGDPA